MKLKPKSWFIKLILVSILVVLLIYDYSLYKDVMEQSGPVSQEVDAKQNPAAKENLTNSRNLSANIELKLEEKIKHATSPGSLNEWLPKLQEIIKGLQGIVEEHSNNTQQQQQLQKQQEKTSKDEFNKRTRRINYVCSTGRVSGNVSQIMTHKQAGIVYCIVPKAGCTFWKSVFTAVNSQKNDTKETIMSLTREAVHNPNSTQIEFNNTEFTTTKYPTRLMVVRDPYSRLVSAYLDKIYLPNFWKSEVLTMAEKLPRNSSSIINTDFLRNHFNDMANILENKSNISRITTGAGSKCGKYMTFSEFVESGFERAEPHWMPIHDICNPCRFQATHISTMETFTADARVVLSQMNLENIMDNVDEVAQTDKEIDIISYYTFRHFYMNETLEFYQPCLSQKEIAYRLWYNFRWRGYIDPDIDYKIPELTDGKDIEADFMAQVRAARKSGLQSPQKMKAAKKEFKKKAFLSISKAMFEKLSQKYALDFELFGYTDLRDEMYTYYSNEGHFKPSTSPNATLALT